MLIDAIDESGRGTAISSTELSIAVDLLSSWQWLSSRPNNISGEFIAAYSRIYYLHLLRRTKCSKLKILSFCNFDSALSSCDKTIIFVLHRVNGRMLFK